MHRSVFLPLAALTLLLTACRGTVAMTPAPTTTARAAVTAACGPLSTLEPNASMGGYALAHAGPLWFSAFGRVRSGPAVITDFFPGEPTKVVIRPDPSLQETVELRGTACADETPLHCCYRQGSCGFTGQPVSPAVLAQRGQAVLTVAPGVGDDTGYMLFPRAGKYRLVVTAGARVVGEVILLIRASALPTASKAPTVAVTVHPATTTGSVASVAIATATGERASLAARPLHLPVLAPGTPCPVTSWQPAGKPDGTDFQPTWSSFAFGPGPVYPIFYQFDPTNRTVQPSHNAVSGWTFDKVLCLITPSYRAPALVRARRLAPPAILPFFHSQAGSSDETVLQLPAAALPVAWRTSGSGVHFPTPAPGCYAFQVDGQYFSDVIVVAVAS